MAEYRVFLVDRMSERWRYEKDRGRLLGGLVVKGVTLCGAVVVIWIAMDLISAGGAGILVASVLIVIGTVLIDRCHLLPRWIESRIRDRHHAKFAAETTPETVLYLRSFGDDRTLVYAPIASRSWCAPLIPQRVRFEELVESWTFNQASSVVAIGRPGERRPTLGAERTYWSDETWRDAVRRTAARCKAVILVAGVTEGLRWEIETLADMGVLGKTLLLLPPDSPENTRLRYERIAGSIPGRHDVLVEGALPLRAVPALGYTADGDLVHYTSFGRDWAAFVMAEIHLLGTLSSGWSFEKAGNMMQLVEVSEDPVAQARYALRLPGGADLANGLLDEAVTADGATMATRIRLDVARAAVLLASGGTPAQVVEALSTRASGDGQVEPDADSVALLDRAITLAKSGGSAPDDLFALVLPEDLFHSGRKLRSERIPASTQVKVSGLWQRTVQLQEQGEHTAAIDSARASGGLARHAGFQLTAAQSDVFVAESLDKLGRHEEAAELAREVLSRDLPDEVKILGTKLLAIDVQDHATQVLIGATPMSADGRREQVRALERHYHRQGAAGRRSSAAETAQRLALYFVEEGQTANARRWGEAALAQFGEIGLPGEQAQTSITLGRAALGDRLFAEAAERARYALELIEENDFASMRGDALLLAKLAAEGDSSTDSDDPPGLTPLDSTEESPVKRKDRDDHV
ncbi:MAG: hypothetical protein KF808_00355 [Cryobacterium sp.]|nr:hypothetical protein [Cryobacterium sp.]